MTNDEKKSWAEELLREKHKELGRLPRKDDFDEPTRSRIKAFLGPWPRALEAAGLKEPRPITSKSAKRKKSATKSKMQATAFAGRVGGGWYSVFMTCPVVRQAGT